MADEYLIGADATRGILRRIADSMPGRVGRALYEEANIELTEAKKRTPVDTGALRASGIVSKPVIDGAETYVEIKFGGPAAEYAIHVHENLEAIHPVGQAKYLESVLLESAPYMASRLGRRLDLK